MVLLNSPRARSLKFLKVVSGRQSTHKIRCGLLTDIMHRGLRLTASGGWRGVDRVGDELGAPVAGTRVSETRTQADATSASGAAGGLNALASRAQLAGRRLFRADKPHLCLCGIRCLSGLQLFAAVCFQPSCLSQCYEWIQCFSSGRDCVQARTRGRPSGLPQPAET